MSNSPHFPNFWEVLAEALKSSAQKRGFWAYVPWYLALLVGAAAFVDFLLETLQAADIESSNAIAALSAMIVVGGLLSAVSVACMTQIYVTVGEPKFGDYLRDEKVLDRFLFWPQFTLLIQIVYVLISAMGIISCAAASAASLRMLLLVEDVALLLYTTTKTWQLIDTMRLLAWHRQEYETLSMDVARRNNCTNVERITR